MWHRDREHRSVSVLEGRGWLLQLDGELPVQLIEGEDHIIPAGVWHRVIMERGAGTLRVLIERLDTERELQAEMLGGFGARAKSVIKSTLGMNKPKEFGAGDDKILFKDSDLNVSSDTRNFALLMNRVAGNLGLARPIITSGLRPPPRQIDAMLELWKKYGSEHLIDLYTYKCKSCNAGAGVTIRKLVNLWDKNRSAILGGIPKEIKEESIEIVSKSPISSHQSGNALDYGTNSNSKEDIKRLLDHIESNGLANFELIDETEGDIPHWHVTVHGVAPTGIDLIRGTKTVQSQIEERKKRKKKLPGKSDYYVGKKTRQTKSNRQMAYEIEKCSKEPRPKSCYDEWTADKTYKSKEGQKNESVEAHLDSIIDEALDLIVEDILEEKLSKKTRETLKKKAEKANMPLGALTGVYRKGLAAWLTGHRQGVPQHGWAMGRVNSFIRGGKARSVDKSEWKKVQKHRKK